MTDSPIFNEWMEQTTAQSELRGARRALTRVLNARFPGQVPADVIETIESQPSLSLLDDWAGQLGPNATPETFRAYLRR